MVEEPDRLRREIESTRASLTRDVDLLAEKTSPRQVARRRWTAVKEKVMGTTDQARYATSDKLDTAQSKASQVGDRVSDAASRVGDAASSTAHGAADAVRNAPRAVAGQTQGNPLAAGIIAFGVGMLAATLIPVSDAEKRAGYEIKEHSGEFTDKVKDVAGDLKDDVSGSVQQAAGQVKETARDAVQATKETARSDAQDVRAEAQRAAS